MAQVLPRRAVSGTPERAGVSTTTEMKHDGPRYSNTYATRSGRDIDVHPALGPQATAAMSPGTPTEGPSANAEAALDPISRQILERTQSQHKATQNLQTATPSHAESEPSDEPGKPSSEPVLVRRLDSTPSSKLTKDKKKGVSFLSRIMGTKKRDDFDTVSEISENRLAGPDADVFSQPIGFIPKFAAPPKYIKVKAQHRKQKDFDHLFLAQILLGQRPPRGRKTSIDSKIHSIDDSPPEPTGPATGPASKATWAMEFSKDGRYLAAAGQDKKLRVWEVISTVDDREMEEKSSAETNNAGENVKLNAPVFKRKLVREYDGHTSSILDLSWSKNNFLLSSSMDKTVRLYHISRAECLCAFKHNDFVTSIQFHPRDDRFFLAGSLDSKIRLWSIPDKTVAYWTQVPAMVTAVAFTPDGKTAIAGCLNGICILYDTEGLRAHSQIHVRSARGRNAKGSKITGIDTFALSRENAPPEVKLLITSNDSRVRMYNLKDRTLEVKFRGNENMCSQIHASFSDDGKYVICGSEDRKVYIWPTAPNERPDNDKRPMEVFEAHSTIVTTAILAPTTTRRLLAQSGDPLYDLCNPPPVTLVGRADSVISSRAPTEQSDDKLPKRDLSHKSESPRRAAETPAYLARHSHPGGQIIVTADYTGQIKVFRQDCAYQKRRQDSWDAGSTFSRKIIGRSASVATRNSLTSSSHRNSLNLSVKNQSTDRILNWRNSITLTGTSASNGLLEVRNGSNNDRARSASPKKLLSHRLSLRAGHAEKRSSSNPALSSTTKPDLPNPDGPQIAIVSPSVDSPGSFHSATQETPSPPAGADLLRRRVSSPTGEDLPHSPNDPLFLMDQHSYMAWDTKNTLLPMAKHSPRTPALLGPEGNPLSRASSYVSQLSSELTASENETGDATRTGGGKRVSVNNENDLKCRKCGNSTFRATMTDTGQRFRCKACGTVV